MFRSCYICSGDVTAQTMSVNFQWAKKVIAFENVPTHMCQRCGEKYFDAKVYYQLERLSEQHYGRPGLIPDRSIQFGESRCVAELAGSSYQLPLAGHRSTPAKGNGKKRSKVDLRI